MDQIEIIRNFKKHISLNKEEIQAIMELLVLKKVKKNEYLFHQGENSCPFLLIKSGCLMTYYTDSNQFDHVIQFGQEMWWTGDLNSFTNDVPSLYSIKAVLPSEVYVFDKSLFEVLCEKIPAFEKYFRIIFQNSLVSHQKRIIRNISFTAEEKYLAFQETFPGLELQVAQKQIASYLGITPEFLSKLRRKLSGK